jgi:hypothetical protein
MGVSNTSAAACFVDEAGDTGFDDTVVVRSYHENNCSASPLASWVLDHLDDDDNSCKHRVDCKKA